MKEYKTSKEKCQSMIKGVCDQCGGVLSPLETVDNSGDPTFWSGCESCSKFSNGTSERVYNIAKKMVLERNYKKYSHINDKETDSEEQKLWNTQSQISGACYTVRDVLHFNEEYDSAKENT